MKSFINKMLAGVAVVASLSLGSCVNDLDLMPIGPDEQTEVSNMNDVAAMMAKCYSSLAVSGQGGAGSSDISGLDNGTSQYIRAIFMMNEFPTDEVAWIWQDEGVVDLVTGTWGPSNANIFGTYSRLMVHIAVCNEFIRQMNNGNYPSGADMSVIEQFKLEARALRALSYYYMIDIFGQCSMAWDDMEYGQSPEQWSRKATFDRVVADLEAVRDAWPKDLNGSKVVYGRIGYDAVQALLCKFYLNAETWVGENKWADLWATAQDIIGRHQTGPLGNGLVPDYQALFCGNNDMFAPGGSLSGSLNEILWTVPQEYKLTESYGATTFLIAAAVTGYTDDPKNGYTNSLNYGLNAQWTCMHAREQFSQKFSFSGGVSEDKRTTMWATDMMGHKMANTDFSAFTDGYLPLKFTNLLANADGSFPHTTYEVAPGVTMERFGDPELNKTRYTTTAGFADTDYPMIRLADVYLMAAEASLHGVGNAADAIKYANAVRERAGLPGVPGGVITQEFILDERARELYWENCRRTDLIRLGNKFCFGYNWSWKSNVAGGASYSAHQVLMPIPTDILSVQASFKQNPGY